MWILITRFVTLHCLEGVHQSEVMLESNLDGVEKVENENGKYAFFMESASIEYLVERRCKLSQVMRILKM